MNRLLNAMAKTLANLVNNVIEWSEDQFDDLTNASVAENFRLALALIYLIILVMCFPYEAIANVGVPTVA